MRTCTKCGAPIPLQQGRGARRKMCATCSPSRHRGKQPQPPVAVSGSPAGLVASVTAALTAADALQSHQGQTALMLARRMESGDDSGAALAQLARQLGQTMASALAQETATEVDPVDELRSRRERRRA